MVGAKALAVAWACAVVLAVVATGTTATTTATAHGVAVKAEPQFVCVFLHGFGNFGPDLGPFNPFKPADPVGANTKTDMPMYWGDIKARTKDVCTQAWFYDAETMSRGWTDVGLQKEYCSVIARFKPHAIFTHSMANQVIAAGIQAKLPGCTNIGPGVDQVNWWGLQGPMRGSPVATMAGRLCPNPVIGATANLVGKLCIKTVYTGWALGSAITSLLPQTCPVQWTDVAAKYMSGNMCGRKPANFDVVTDRPMAVVQKKLDDTALSLGSQITAKFIPYDAAWRAGNDGLVSFDSCRIVDAAKYKSNPESNFYLLDGNHADGTCRNGDAADPKDLTFRGCAYIVLAAEKSRNAKAVAGKLETRFVQLHEVSTAETTADVQHVTAALVDVAATAVDEAEDEAENDAEADAELDTEEEAELEDENEEEDEQADEDADADAEQDQTEGDDEAEAEEEDAADAEVDSAADADAEDA